MVTLAGDWAADGEVFSLVDAPGVVAEGLGEWPTTPGASESPTPLASKDAGAAPRASKT